MTTQWAYKGEPVTEPPVGAIGFIYSIVNTKAVDPDCGHYYHKPYVGKKSLHHNHRRKIGVREKAATGTRKRIKVVQKESDWREYWGSCDELLQDVEKLGTEVFERTILEWCYTKKYLTYAEVAHQITNSVLEDTTYNGNVLCKFYRRDIEREWEARDKQREDESK